MLINTYELVGVLEAAFLEPLGLTLKMGIRPKVVPQVLLKETP